MTKKMPMVEVDVILLHSPGQRDTTVELFYSGEEARQRIVDIIKNLVGVWSEGDNPNMLGIDEQDYDDAESGEQGAFDLIDIFNDMNNGYFIEWQERAIAATTLE